VDAPAERLARAENVGSNICVSVCCLMWGRTFVDSWLVFPAPLEVRGSAWKGVQLFWPTVSSWARGKGTLYIRVAGGHLCSLLTRPLGFFIEINVSLPSSCHGVGRDINVQCVLIKEMIIIVDHYTLAVRNRR
jgi:hypothetical protein